MCCDCCRKQRRACMQQGRSCKKWRMLEVLLKRRLPAWRQCCSNLHPTLHRSANAHPPCSFKADILHMLHSPHHMICSGLRRPCGLTSGPPWSMRYVQIALLLLLLLSGLALHIQSQTRREAMIDLMILRVLGLAVVRRYHEP